MHSSGRDEVLDTCSDHDLVVFLEGAGVADPEAVLDDPQWVEWRGGHAHELREMGVLVSSYEPHPPKAGGGGGVDRYRWEEVMELFAPRVSERS